MKNRLRTTTSDWDSEIEDLISEAQFIIDKHLKPHCNTVNCSTEGNKTFLSDAAAGLSR